MKKTLLIIATLASTAGMAQNSAVTSAFMAMEDNKLAEAAGYIEPTILNEGTMVKEKTWRYRGQIYQRIAFSDDAALKTQYPDALDKQEVLFSNIETAVLSGQADAGLIIHENRFTYAQHGLVKVLDLGEYWEQTTGLPIPLGGIVVHRDLPAEVQ